MAVRFVSLFFVYTSLVVTVAACDPCENRVLQELPDPSSERKAVVFQRSCGTFGGTSTQISVLPISASYLIAGGNTFSADTDGGAAPALPSGGPPVVVTWASAQNLKVTYDSRVRVFQAVAQVNNVTIAYEARTASNKNSQETPSPKSSKTKTVKSHN